MSYKFLIIDDEPNLREVLTDFMQEMYSHSKIDTANNGEDALSLANENTYDVILTDFKMPKMNGAEFILSLRQGNGPNKDTGILMITAFGDLVQLEMSNLENTLILNKPISLERLDSNIKMFLSSRLI